MKIEVNSIVQITKETHYWFPALVIVSELKSFGIQGYVFLPSNDIKDRKVDIRLEHDDYEAVGKAIIVPWGKNFK